VTNLRYSLKFRESKKKKDSIITNCSGFSTVFDALFLLVLISLAGVLLIPSMQAEKQYSADSYVTSSELDTYVLESLLSCKLDDFQYEISPMSALNLSMPENSVVKNASYTLFGKEQKHRTFADLTAEYLALSLKIPTKGSFNDSINSFSLPLNSLAADYSSQDSEVISAYLDQKFAGRFSYRFEAYWRPVETFPMESELIIGMEPPVNAIRQSTKLSMPLYASATSRDPLLICINDSVLEDALNSSDKEASNALSQAFNASLDAAAQEGAEAVVELLFPSGYSGSIFGEETDESLEILLYGISENSDENSSSTEMFNSYFSDTLAASFQLDSTSYSENSENTSATDLSVLKELMTARIKVEIRKELGFEFSDEIKKVVPSMLETDDLSEAQALRDSFIESVYREINPGGARIVLSLWNPVS
jgi:hypothetical protein